MGKLSRAERRAAFAEARAMATRPQPRADGGGDGTGAGGWGGFGFGGYGYGNGHQGADFTRMRGYVYFPELDTRREITTYARTEILRRSRFLVANYGIAKRLIFGIARMVAGTGLTPQPTTTDRAWNKLAEKAFARVGGSRFSYDLGGRYNFWRSQAACLGFLYRDGDYGQALGRTAAGAPAMAFYESHQIGQGLTPGDPAMRDGVRLGAHNQALAYRILGDEGAFADVPASALIFGCRYDRAGQSRGLPLTSHAINGLLDAAEILGFIKQGVKLANRVGHWLEYAPGTVKSKTPGDRMAGPTQRMESSLGPVEFEKIYGGGMIPDLPAGASIKTNGSTHPHPNNLNLIDYLIRDISWGAGLSPEILWNIAALGGANTRFVLADAQGFLEQEQQDLIDTKLQREYLYVLSMEMAAGRLRKCADPEWWKCAWIPPPRLTVDFGRDGKLHMSMIKMGALTFRRFYGWQGLEADEQRETWLDELADLKAGLNAENAAKRTPTDRNLTWEDLAAFRNEAGNNAHAAPNADATDDGANPDAVPTGLTSAALAEIVKDPAKAQAYLRHCMAQPFTDGT